MYKAFRGHLFWSSGSGDFACLQVEPSETKIIGALPGMFVSLKSEGRSTKSIVTWCHPPTRCLLQLRQQRTQQSGALVSKNGFIVSCQLTWRHFICATECEDFACLIDPLAVN